MLVDPGQNVAVYVAAAEGWLRKLTGVHVRSARALGFATGSVAEGKARRL